VYDRTKSFRYLLDEIWRDLFWPCERALFTLTCSAGTSKTLISVTGEVFACWLSWFMVKISPLD